MAPAAKDKPATRAEPKSTAKTDIKIGHRADAKSPPNPAKPEQTFQKAQPKKDTTLEIKTGKTVTKIGPASASTTKFVSSLVDEDVNTEPAIGKAKIEHERQKEAQERENEMAKLKDLERQQQELDQKQKKLDEQQKDLDVKDKVKEKDKLQEELVAKQKARKEKRLEAERQEAEKLKRLEEFKQIDVDQANSMILLFFIFCSFFSLLLPSPLPSSSFSYILQRHTRRRSKT